MSAYEHVVYLYSSLHDNYKWTRQQIDNEELEYILDLQVVLAKVRSDDKDKISYIDEVI